MRSLRVNFFTVLVVGFIVGHEFSCPSCSSFKVNSPSCEISSVLDVLGWLESPCTVFRGSFGHVEGLVGLSDEGFEMTALAIFG